jgi:uncharacterized GH25 family protein
MKRAFQVVLLIGLFGAAVASYGKEATGTLAGVVLDAKGKPVANATVTIQTSDGLHPHATHTDSDGRFEFARYRTGQYDVRAFARGDFSDWMKRLTIRARKTTAVTLRMPPEPDIIVTVPR